MKPCPSLGKKIAEYQEENRGGFSPFTPVRETNFGKKMKRSRKSQSSGKCRKLDIGHYAPSTVVSTCPMTTATTTTSKMSVPFNLLNILDVPTIPKLPAPSNLSRTWANPYTTPVSLSSQYIQIGH